MEIKLPEGSNQYLILVGIFFGVASLFVGVEEGGRFFNVYLSILAIIFFYLGWRGLDKKEKRGERKEEEEIKILKENLRKAKADADFEVSLCEKKLRSLKGGTHPLHFERAKHSSKEE